MRTPRSLWKLVLLQFLTYSFCPPQEASFKGVNIEDPSDPRLCQLEGVVRDEKGEPLAAATVTAQPEGALGAILPHARTDAQGRFTLTGLFAGKAFLSASKPDAFYADTSWGLWDLGPGSRKLDLPEGARVSNIVLQVPPVASLEIRAVNAMGSAAIESFGVHIERDGNPSRYIGGVSQR